MRAAYPRANRSTRLFQGHDTSSAITLQVAVLAVWCCAFQGLARATANCQVKEYREVRNFVDPSTGVGLVYATVPREGLTVEGLLCVSDTQRKEHPDWKDVLIAFFTSHDAAQHFTGTPHYVTVIDGAGNTSEQWNDGRGSEYRATYVLNVAERQSYLELMPMGFETGATYVSRFDVPLDARPVCNLSLAGRCVLSMAPMDLPKEAWSRQPVGSVTLTGRVARDGSLVDVRINNASAQTPDIAELITNEGRKNLGTWWLEASTEESAFTVTYEYVTSRDVPIGTTILEVATPRLRIVHGYVSLR